MRKILTKVMLLGLGALAVVPMASCGKEVIYVADKRGSTPTPTQGGGDQTGTTPTQTTTQAPAPVDDNPGDGTTYNLTVWCAQEDVEMITTMLSAYEEKYNKNTYNWKVEKQGEDIVSSTVVRDVSAAADVFSFANDQIGTLMQNQALAPISSAYTAQIDEQIDVAKLAATFNNAYYAIPYSYENCFLYYNKSLISDVSTMEGILSKSIPGVTHNLGIDMADSYYTTMFLYTAGLTIFGDQGTNPNDVDFTSATAYPKSVKACKYIASLNSKSKLNSIAKADQYAALANKNVAAMISGPHMISLFKAALGDDFGVAMLPKIRFEGESTDTQLVSFSGVKMYGVTQKAATVRDQKTTNEAMKVAAYLANKENQQIRLEEREFCPTDSDLFEEAVDSGIKTVEVVVNQSEYSRLKPGIIQMSNYWDNMKGFLQGVYKLSYAETSWKTELQKIEAKLKS